MVGGVGGGGRNCLYFIDYWAGCVFLVHLASAGSTPLVWPTSICHNLVKLQSAPSKFPEAMAFDYNIKWSWNP